jgi:CheY-like chemotaxis protein
MPTVLFIDDDPVLLKLYSTRLAADGYQVMIANNGEDAIEQIKTTMPDLIVADLLMPKLNGFSLLEYLNSQPLYANMIKIVFSSVVNEEQIGRLQALGVKQYLNKTDTTPTQLVETIKTFLPNQTAPVPETST